MSLYRLHRFNFEFQNNIVYFYSSYMTPDANEFFLVFFNLPSLKEKIINESTLEEQRTVIKNILSKLFEKQLITSNSWGDWFYLNFDKMIEFGALMFMTNVLEREIT